MAQYRYIVLDEHPLSNAAVPHATQGVAPSSSQQGRQWLTECSASGLSFIVPAIAYYEAIREMELRNAARQIERFQNFCF